MWHVMTKTFSEDELIALVHVLLNRLQMNPKITGNYITPLAVRIYSNRALLPNREQQESSRISPKAPSIGTASNEPRSHEGNRTQPMCRLWCQMMIAEICIVEICIVLHL